MWVWVWRNVFCSVKWKHTWTGCLVFNSLHFFTSAVIYSLTFPSACGYLGIRGHPGVPHLWNNLKDFSSLYLFLLCCVWHSKWVRAKTNSQNKAHLFDRPLPPHIWSHPPTCGIEEEDLSKLRSWEVYFDWMPWFPHPKWSHVVGIQWGRGLLWFHSCVYNAHRTVVLSGLWSSWMIVEIQVGWNSCHSHTYSIWCPWNE